MTLKGTLYDSADAQRFGPSGGTSLRSGEEPPGPPSRLFGSVLMCAAGASVCRWGVPSATWAQSAASSGRVCKSGKPLAQTEACSLCPEPRFRVQVSTCCSYRRRSDADRRERALPYHQVGRHDDQGQYCRGAELVWEFRYPSSTRRGACRRRRLRGGRVSA